jgi:hypothetical protein
VPVEIDPAHAYDVPFHLTVIRNLRQDVRGRVEVIVAGKSLLTLGSCPKNPESHQNLMTFAVDHIPFFGNILFVQF